ncbi:mechanosensitive ion channel domain-containing protein [Polymorphum gilvum]|uniref:Transporter, MscS family n=1 Tax=Polymorphum gilvum (strain LMG 25793 / CGMCC 1.9160 / SL003B-26A1) TaxID=991905 RepID=F2IXQ7_POLGS|nr:mechanosensitive ion channel domain-containing protein [Polymorphum gilvum]ADZ69388.1 Transporter, MscS family [Polymorphum gilvum SL003B-26A1]
MPTLLRPFASFLLVLLLAVPVLAQDTAPTGGSTEVAEEPVPAASELPGQDGSTASEDTAAARDALVRLLQDPAGRAALIGLLQGLNAGAGADRPAAAPAVAPTAGTSVAETAARETFALWIGDYTRGLIADVADVTARLTSSLKGFTLLVKGDVTVKWDRVQQTLVELIAVFGCAMVVYLAAQMVAIRFFDALEQKAERRGWLWKAGVLVLGTLVDVVTIGLGFIGGTVAALAEFGPLLPGISLFENLTLNAFVATALARVAVRFVFAPRREKLRLLPFSTPSAKYWSSRIGFVIALLGYGVMLAVPMANLTISFVVGNALRVVIVFAAAALSIAIILINRVKVRDETIRYAATLDSELARHALTILGRTWAVLAVAYILTVFGIWITRPFEAVGLLMRSTSLSILTIMAGFLLSLVMTRAIDGGIRVPADLRQTLPALEGRLNAFVPRLLKIMRMIVFLGTIFILADIWSVLDFSSLVRSEVGSAFLGRFASAGITVLVAFAIWLTVMSWVDLRLRERSGYIISSRERTLFQLFRNAFTVVVIIMAALLSLSELGVDIGPLIAGAGVLGLAVSFGAQTLVKDIITGAFIQIENAINEGDVVTVGGVTGVVERLTVRSVRIRDLDGTTHIVPFSSVDMVSNFMRDFSYHVALVGVSYDTDIRQAKAAMQEAFDRLKASPAGASIIGDLEMHGVVNFGASSVDLRARIKTFPGSQWATGRAYNEFIKDVFDERGIEIPFPQVTYHEGRPHPAAGRGRDGQAPAGEDAGDADAPAGSAGAPGSA